MSTQTMLSEAQIKEIIYARLKTIAPESDPRRLKPDENVREALDIDSFDHLNLLIALHEALGIEIPESDYGELNTLNQMVRYIAARVR